MRAVQRGLVGVCLLVTASGALAGAAAAQTDAPPAPSTSVVPTTAPDPVPSSSTPTTTPPASEPSTTAPEPASSTTTTRPPADQPASTAPADHVAVPTAAEQAAAQAQFVALTDGQRTILRRLQGARDQLATARIEVVTLAVEVAAAQRRLADADAAAGAAEHGVADARHRLDVLHGQVMQLAGAMYQHLSTDVVLDTVNTAGRSEVNRVRTYARAPQDVLDELVARAAARKHELAAARAHATTARATARTTFDVVQRALHEQQHALAAAEQASDDATAAASDALGTNVALLTQVAAPQFGADSITAVLAAVQAGAGEPATLVGLFHDPVPGAPLGSPYGIRVDPLSGSLGYHPGIDLEAPAGAEVHAAAPGVVVIAGDCGGYGNCVVVDHGHSLATVYGHLSRTAVGSGDLVADGAVIGLVGSTGQSTGPHLHLEVRLHGTPVDPLLTLTA